jgi:hypothetical protein
MYSSTQIIVLLMNLSLVYFSLTYIYGNTDELELTKAVRNSPLDTII